MIDVVPIVMTLFEVDEDLFFQIPLFRVIAREVPMVKISPS